MSPFSFSIYPFPSTLPRLPLSLAFLYPSPSSISHLPLSFIFLYRFPSSLPHLPLPSLPFSLPYSPNLPLPFPTPLIFPIPSYPIPFLSHRLCKSLEDIHRSSAMQDARKRRSQLAQDCVRLGKIVSMRMVRSSWISWSTVYLSNRFFVFLDFDF